MDGFAALNAFFGRAVVLTLPDAIERHERLRERLAGLDYELLHGFDARGLGVAELERRGLYDDARGRLATRHRRALRPAEIGCALSHRAAYQRLLAEGRPRALLFEDDAVPVAAALDRVEAALFQLPATWELLYLGWEGGERVTASGRLKQAAYLALSAVRLIHWTPREVLGLLPSPFSENLRRAGKHHCAHAYAVSAAGAQKLLAASTPVVYSADQLLLQYCIDRRLEAYITVPKFFDQDSYRGRAASLVQVAT